MKKAKNRNFIFKYCLFSTLTIFISNSYAALPTGATLYDVNIPSLYGGLNIGITALHWNTSLTQDNFALTNPTSEIIDLHDFHGCRFRPACADNRWNYKFKIGYIIPFTGNEVQVNILNYHQSICAQRHEIILPMLSDKWPTSAVLTISNPFLLDSSITLGIPSMPGTAIPRPIEPNCSTARLTVNHDAIDLDFNQSINLGCRTRIKYYAGLRFVRLNDQLNVMYNHTSFSPDDVVLEGINPNTNITTALFVDLTEVVNQRTNYSGLGPHFGIDFAYYLRWGFGLVGNISSSVIAGNMKKNLFEAFTRTATATVMESNIDQVLVNSQFTKKTQEESSIDFAHRNTIVPNIDARLGLDYTYQKCNCSHTKWTAEVGYMVSYYFNFVERVSAVEVNNSINRSQTLDVHFNGFYVSLQVKV